MFTIRPLGESYSLFMIHDSPRYGSRSDPATLCAALEQLGKVMEADRGN